MFARIRVFFIVLLCLCCASPGYAGFFVTVVTDGYLTEKLSAKQPVGDYVLKADLPTKVSQLDNDSGYITTGALTDYVMRTEMTTALSAKADVSALESHVSNTSNPHSVSKAQVGLANVQNVDQTNATNLTSGTVAYGRLPVGVVANTVAAGDDVRFNTIPTTAPTGTPPSGQVYIWFN